MSFTEAVRSVYRNYAKFDGRASRSEYWWFQLFVILVILAGYFVTALLAIATRSYGLFGLAVIALVVFWIATLIPTLAVTVRRLHDSDKSGWWLLIIFLPYVGAFVVLIFTLLASTPGHNRYGPAFGQPTGAERAQYWGPTRSEALRQFAEDAQKAAAAGYEPVWQEWRQQGGTEVLEVSYARRPPDPPWRAPGNLG